MFRSDLRHSENGMIGFGIGFREGTVGQGDEPAVRLPEFPDDLTFGGDLEKPVGRALADQRVAVGRSSRT